MKESKNYLPIKTEEAVGVKRIFRSECDMLVGFIWENNAALYKIVRCYGFSHEDAENMLQDTYLNAYAQIASLEYGITFKTFIIKILVHKCVYNSSISYFKQVLKDGVYPTAGEQVNSYPNEYNKCIRGITLKYYQALEMNLYQLPISCRTVYILGEIGGYNIKEIAALINTTTINVINRFNTAKAIINKEFLNYTSSARALGYDLSYTSQMVEKTLLKIKLSNKSVSSAQENQFN